MISRNQNIIGLLALSVAVLFLTREFIEAFKVYVVSVVVFITIILNTLYASERIMRAIAEKFANILVNEYIMREAVKKYIDAHFENILKERNENRLS